VLERNIMVRGDVKKTYGDKQCENKINTVIGSVQNECGDMQC